MTQKKPIIGITPSHNTENNDTSLRPTYPKAIAAAGGLPILLPLECSDEDIKQFMDVCDGFLFTGGPDINPFLFGEDTHLKCGNISAARDHLEFRLLSAAMDAGKPIFGICRGVQVLNVGLGGSLYQDIPSQTEREFPIAHQQPFYYNIPCHRVNITENTLLHSICHGETQIAVNSSHHQCVHIPAPGLVVSAVAPDGIIEAVEKPDYLNFFLGVQWHPEYLWDRDEASMGLFQAFVDACKRVV